MELGKRQKIIIMAVFFAVILLVVMFFMISSYNRMEEDGQMMSSADLSFYQQTKNYIGSEYESFAVSKGWQYKSLSGRNHSLGSQYNPEFTISEGEQFCGNTSIQQNLNYITSEDAITYNTRFDCTAAGWEETVRVLTEYIPDIVEIHNLYGTEELTEEALTNFISDNLPVEAPTDDSSRPDPNDKSQLVLLSSYNPEDDNYNDPHYKITLYIIDYLDENKLPEEIVSLKE